MDYISDMFVDWVWREEASEALEAEMQDFDELMKTAEEYGGED